MVSTTRDKEVFLLAPGDHSNNAVNNHPVGQGSILVVEDDAPTLRLERVLLEEEGYSVEVVGSGEEAIEAISAKRPLLVLLDIGLPGMDGFTVCRRIREISRVPIIMVTGRDCLDDKVKGMNVGADDYVTKPFLTHELATRVKVVLRRSSVENGALQELNGTANHSLHVDLTSNGSSNGAASSHHSQVAGKPDNSEESAHPEKSSPEPAVSQEVASSQEDTAEEGPDSSVSDTPGPASLQETASSQEDSPEAVLGSSPVDVPGPAPSNLPSTSPATSPADTEDVRPESAQADAPSEETVSPGLTPAPEPQNSDGVYEGNVRLTVTTRGPVSHLITFVSELRQNSQFRLLRLVANQHKEGMDIWLGLREPLSLKDSLGAIDGVSEVNLSPEASLETEEPVFKVILD